MAKRVNAGVAPAHGETGAMAYTDDAAACRGVPELDCEAVERTIVEHMRGVARTDGAAPIP